MAEAFTARGLTVTMVEQAPVVMPTVDVELGRLLGAQLVGDHRAEVAKRIDVPAGALFHRMTVDGLSDLDLSYTPPFGSPWDAIQPAAQDWVRQTSVLPA